jgi:hypothetical protein
MAFDGAFLKIQRAQTQREQLRKEISAFLDPHNGPFELVLEYDADSDRDRVVFMVKRDTPPLWSVIIGEILHDLRSALDHLVYEASDKDGNGEAPPGTEWPIFIDEVRYRNRAKGGGRYKIRGLSAPYQALVEKYQPFNYEEAPRLQYLWILHELSNIDKHRLLVLTHAAHGLSQVALEPPPTMFIAQQDLREDGPLEDGAVLASWQAFGVVQARLAVKTNITHYIAFKPPSPALPGWDVEHILDRIGLFVAAMANEFRKIA